VCSKRKEKNSTSWVLLFLFPLFVLLVSRGLQFLLSHLGFFVGLGLGSLVVALLFNCVHNPFYLTLSFLFFFFFFWGNSVDTNCAPKFIAVLFIQAESMGTVAEEAAALSFFVEGRVPEQREQGKNGLLFPQVLKPGAASSADVNSLVAAIRKDKDWLEQQLELYGALLLRDFGVHTAEDFNAVVEAFDYPELPYIGGAAPRFKVVGRVYTTNESPPDQLVPFHHEMAQVLLLLLLLLLVPMSQSCSHHIHPPHICMFSQATNKS
jgi:hypothetical protein